MPGELLLDGPDSGNYSQRPLAAADFDNRAAFTTGQASVAAAGSPEQAPSVTIPEGFAISIKARPTNTGNVFLGNSAANVLLATVRYTLRPNEAVSLRITNLNLVWLDVAVGAEGISYIVEQ